MAVSDITLAHFWQYFQEPPRLTNLEMGSDNIIFMICGKWYLFQCTVDSKSMNPKYDLLFPLLVQVLLVYTPYTSIREQRAEIHGKYKPTKERGVQKKEKRTSKLRKASFSYSNFQSLRKSWPRGMLLNRPEHHSEMLNY